MNNKALLKKVNGYEAGNNLEKAVLRWVKEELEEENYSCFEVLQKHGCQTGMVGGLIYYEDTAKFYKKHKAEINVLLYEMLSSTGLSTSELFGDKFDKEDPLCFEENNQNLLAWYGFEETASRIGREIGLEL